MMMFMQSNCLHLFLLNGRKIHLCSSYKVHGIWVDLVFHMGGVGGLNCSLKAVFFCLGA